eukprot:m.199730 g.199730  ORF g.199730 m.199730 type:complete len:112 (+) comp25924_c0_seq1:187-522(+)
MRKRTKEEWDEVKEEQNHKLILESVKVKKSELSQQSTEREKIEEKLAMEEQQLQRELQVDLDELQEKLKSDTSRLDSLREAGPEHYDAIPFSHESVSSLLHKLRADNWLPA